jgi:serine/threonine protein kinase
MLLADRYRLDETLASGGMGRVWRAHDELLSRPVAVKEICLPPTVSERDREVLRERTIREARAAGRLDHPSIVKVYDVVESDGRPWLVMQYVEAKSLHDVVRHDGPLRPRKAAEVGLSIAGALATAHAAGIVHRDVKPRNILLPGDPAAMLTDFGIATSSGDDAITDEGVLIGSPAYMSPEQARGERPGPAGDLWSLGATLYLAVEGRPPFDGGSPVGTLVAVMLTDPAEPGAAGPLRDLVCALLTKEPASRPSMAEVCDTLAEVARGAEPAVTAVPTATVALQPAVAALLAEASRLGASTVKDAAERLALTANTAMARRRDPAPRSRPRWRFKKRWVAVPLAAVLTVVVLVIAAVALTVWALVGALG